MILPAAAADQRTMHQRWSHWVQQTAAPQNQNLHSVMAGWRTENLILSGPQPVSKSARFLIRCATLDRFQVGGYCVAMVAV